MTEPWRPEPPEPPGDRAAPPDGVDDPTAEIRRTLMRQANQQMYTFIAVAVIVALLGAALVAFLLRGAGWPFLRTWGILVAVLLLPPAVGAVIRNVRSSGRH